MKKFGIELEGYCDVNYKDDEIDGWKFVFDGSLDEDADYGFEAVSPVLELDEVNSVEKILGMLKNDGWYVNSDCGTHIHMSDTDYKPADMVKLYLLTHILEPTIYGCLSMRRFTGTYSKKSNTDSVSKFLHYVKEYGASCWDDIEVFHAAYYDHEIDDIKSRSYVLDKDNYDKYESERYYGLNFHSWFYRRTIEFRYFEGVNNIQEVHKWLEFCSKLMEFARQIDVAQLPLIAHNFWSINDLDESVVALNCLLDMEHKLVATNDESYERCRNNVSGHYRLTRAPEQSTTLTA